MYAKTSTLLLRICVYAQIIQRWKTLLSKITLRNFLACTQKNFHLSIKDLPACTNNTIQRRKIFLSNITIGISAHVRKNLLRLY